MVKSTIDYARYLGL